MIEKIREYVAKCPYIEELNQILINYMADDIKACSINEEVSYNPIVEKYITGYKECQFRFNLDIKLHWNEDLITNIENSKVYENFSQWLEKMDKAGNYPDIDGINIHYIGATSNGYIYMTESNEAIYRMSCVMNYGRS